MKLQDDKDHHTNGNTNSQSGDINDPVTDQISKCRFELVIKHNRVGLHGKLPNEYRLMIIMTINQLLFLHESEVYVFGTVVFAFITRLKPRSIKLPPTFRYLCRDRNWQHSCRWKNYNAVIFVRLIYNVLQYLHKYLCCTQPYL